MEFIFLTCAAMTLILQGQADCPPPTRLKQEWLDPFTVNVSWDKPAGLQGEIKYKYSTVKDGEESVTRTTIRNFTEICLTEELDSDGWTYSVWTDGSQSCNGSNESKRVDITFRNRKPKAKVVEDFRCVIHGGETDCTWIPVDPSLNLMLSYRIYEKRVRTLNHCSQFYSRGGRTGCRLKVDTAKEDICILVETAAGMSTFRPKLEVPTPELNVTKEEHQLRLDWNRPEVGKDCIWKYELCHTQCNRARGCKNHTFSGEPSMKMSYDETCRYEFRSRVLTEEYCISLTSGFSKAVTYGTNKPPDRTQTVIAIVIPIILSICVLLSCYCLRRHRAILCPTIPDPSVIFKEMMMNGNKELKTAPGNLYTPVPEPVEPWRLTPVNENNILQQNV